MWGCFLLSCWLREEPDPHLATASIKELQRRKRSHLSLLFSGLSLLSSLGCSRIWDSTGQTQTWTGRVGIGWHCTASGALSHSQGALWGQLSTNAAGKPWLIQVEGVLPHLSLSARVSCPCWCPSVGQPAVQLSPSAGRDVLACLRLGNQGFCADAFRLLSGFKIVPTFCSWDIWMITLLLGQFFHPCLLWQYCLPAVQCGSSKAKCCLQAELPPSVCPKVKHHAEKKLWE